MMTVVTEFDEISITHSLQKITKIDKEILSLISIYSTLLCSWKENRFSECKGFKNTMGIDPKKCNIPNFPVTPST